MVKTRSTRVAKRRDQRRARREERLRQQALLDSLGSTEWEDEELEGTPTEQIIETLSKLGIQTDEDSFRELALAHGSVDGIAEGWRAQGTTPGLWEDYPWLAARALWPRWTPDLFSVDVFIEQHLGSVGFDDEDPETLEDAQSQWQTAQAVMDLVAPQGGPDRPELLEELTDHSAIDVGFWLGCLPLSLERLGMVNEAVEICRRMAPVYEPVNFLTDLAEILARAGRREEALRQVEENLARFPDDFWVRINAGDVHMDFGDLTMAEAVYRQAMANEVGHLRGVAIERLVTLLRETGRQAEAAALLAEPEANDDQNEEVRAAEYEEEAGDFEPEDAAPTEVEASYLAQAGLAPPVTIPATRCPTGLKVGRNELCPCGSGKKFKRCCGR